MLTLLSLKNKKLNVCMCACQFTQAAYVRFSIFVCKSAVNKARTKEQEEDTKWTLLKIIRGK